MVRSLGTPPVDENTAVDNGALIGNDTGNFNAAGAMAL
jgi:hypothetical protein